MNVINTVLRWYSPESVILNTKRASALNVIKLRVEETIEGRTKIRSAFYFKFKAL